MSDTGGPALGQALMFYWGAGDGLGNISRRMVEVAVGGVPCTRRGTMMRYRLCDAS